MNVENITEESIIHEIRKEKAFWFGKDKKVTFNLKKKLTGWRVIQHLLSKLQDT
jgi:hypothetical protein